MLPHWLQPDLSSSTLDLFRASYGVLLIAHLLSCLPHARRFFLSERWGGYGKSSPFVDALHNPQVMVVVLVAWFACGVLLVLGDFSPYPALVNLLLCRYYFLNMRWRGLLRGMGAPGFMTNWLASAAFALELTRHATPGLFPLALFVLQVDFALIMFMAGLYKFNSGYAGGEGMELGMVNPQWGRWWRLSRKMPPGHWFFAFNNHMAWAGELVAGVLMLIPATRFWGALFIFLSFIYIHANVRLAVLPFMVMLACVLFAEPAGPGGGLVEGLGRLAPPSRGGIGEWGHLPSVALEGFLWLYLASLPLVYSGLSWNLHRKKPLPRPLQRALDAWANSFGFILWRVFSADVTHFFVRIYRAAPGGERLLLTRWGDVTRVRYSHVAEAITVTCLFTTLKYYPNNPGLFRERLLRYARTVPTESGGLLIFECLAIEKLPSEFRFVPVTEFLVAPEAGRVEEHSLDQARSLGVPVAGSSVHESARPGSYAPASSQESEVRSQEPGVRKRRSVTPFVSSLTPAS
jgi:hypothetical protein